MRLEIGALREFLVASIEGTDVGTVSGVDPDVRPQIEI